MEEIGVYYNIPGKEVECRCWGWLVKFGGMRLKNILSDWTVRRTRLAERSPPKVSS